MIDKNEPDRLILIKKDNPIDLYYNSQDDILYFCSEKAIIKEALKIQSTSARGFNLGEGYYHSYEMQNNHGLLINKDGVESYQRFHPMRDRWFDRSYSYPNEEIMIECPWCFCKTSYHEGKLFNKCEVCGMGINEEDLYVI